MKGKNNMKLGIFGSRTLKDTRVKEIIIDEIQKTGADTIVTPIAVTKIRVPK